MRFEVLDRDGLARVGLLEIDGVKHTTPAVGYVSTPKYQSPEGALRVTSQEADSKGSIEIITESLVPRDSKERTNAVIDTGFRGSPFFDDKGSADFCFVDSIAESLLDSRKFVAEVERMKGGNELLRPAYCSVAGLPNRLAFLAYCGFDVFDSLPLILASENGMFLTNSGPLDYGKLRRLPCSCPSCKSAERSKEALLRHNYSAAEDELNLVRHKIAEGTLRELVEARIRSDPWLVQGLRLLDIEHHDLQEIHAPIKGSKFHAGSKESLSRPDIVRWRKRLEQRYRKPRGAKILLLIPCSAKKPYSLSSSHMRFRDALFASGKSLLVHEVIVTSPLGLVPRELELFYPAKDYDIPVTGHWDRDEKKMAEEMVSWLVTSQKYDHVISHLGDEREPVNSVLTDFIDTSDGSPGSRQSLDKLEKTLRDLVLKDSRYERTERNLDEIRAVSRFQFGEPGERLCDNAQVHGRWPHVRILKSGRQLGMLTADRGMISLTIDGARILAADNAYTVEIEDFEPKGNLFAVGVEDASPEIRIGDDAVVAHEGDVRAVGVARMCAPEMVLADRGEAVHIRHFASE